MKGSERRDVEALVFGELDEGRAAEVRAHVAGCARCAEEAARIRSERLIFARRAGVAAPAPPAFADVLARARRTEPEVSRVRRLAPLLALAAAAAIAGLLTSSRALGPSDEAVAVAIEAEPLAAEACFEGQPLSVEREAFVTDHAIASVEDQYGACLVATPLSGPASAACACALPSDPAVTCGSLRSMGDECLDEGPRGGSIQ